LHKLTLEATLGALLHDTGKPVCRSGNARGNHGDLGYAFLKDIWLDADILDCVRSHHSPDGNLPKDSPLWPVWFANRLCDPNASGNPEGTAGNADASIALRSVFTHLNGEHPGMLLPLRSQGETLPLPQKQTTAASGDYATLVEKLRKELGTLTPAMDNINGILRVLEDCLSFVPADIRPGGEPDISLYDHSKLTAAMAACVSEYLLAIGETDFRSRLWKREEEFREEEAFLLYSADFSGIQKFIFTVATRGALASLRSRSFFLELLMEHYIDELLSGCGVSRANLLYSGGGHCYLLLPNTPAAQAAAETWNLRFNDWLLEEFGPLLFIAHGWTKCSGNDLTNTPAGQERYTAMFRRVSASISAHKLHRYSSEQLRRINSRKAPEDGRECVVCGRSDRLDENSRCFWCASFVSLSPKILGQDVYFVSRDKKEWDFALPAREGDAYFSLINEKTARIRLKSGEAVLRIYQKDQTDSSLPGSIRLYVGDYAAEREMAALSAQSQGIRRLAVCRMDVDNLGHAFTAGFRAPGEADMVKRDRFLTLARTAAFSRQMSLFFKSYINPILEAPEPDGSHLAVAIVYSGGDDVFLVGAWNSVIAAAQRIQEAFAAFCGGSLTLSAGISIHPDTFPIRMAAAQSAELEDRAKQTPGKNSLALFDPEADHTYPWTEFRERVLGEKLTLLQNFFQAEDQERGAVFLHQLLELLRQAKTDKINLARYAYLLAKMEPRDRDRAESYRAFSRSMYRWALSPADRDQLITAIYLHIYMERKEK